MTRLLTHNGQTHSICGWAVKNGITKSAMYQRLERGWTLEEACANKRTHRFARKVKPIASASIKSPSINSLRLDELKRMDLVLQREVTRTLRQFCRDLEAIMSRGVDRDILKSAFDRTTPVTPERV